jgi:hypothetical protein
MDRRMAILNTIMFGRRVLAAGIITLAAGSALPVINGYAQDGETLITCTNPVSGTSWQIMVDYRKQTVDTIPAKITSTGISWFDPRDLSDYTLDRKTGALTAGVASSTGGYFRRARCALENQR